MADRKRTDDLAELARASIEAIAMALSDGDGQYPPGSWAAETLENNLKHLREHFARIERMLSSDGYVVWPELVTELTHFHCRSAILLGHFIRKMGSLG